MSLARGVGQLYQLCGSKATVVVQSAGGRLPYGTRRRRPGAHDGGSDDGEKRGAGGRELTVRAQTRKPGPSAVSKSARAGTNKGKGGRAAMYLI